MCLEENYSDSPSNEYSRHYSAEYEYLRRQNMNSKLGEEQKKSTSVEVLISTQIRIKSKKKVKIIYNGLILGRVSINTRTRLGTSLVCRSQLITLHHTIEHIFDPSPFTCKLRSYLLHRQILFNKRQQNFWKRFAFCPSITKGHIFIWAPCEYFIGSTFIQIRPTKNRV